MNRVANSEFVLLSLIRALFEPAGGGQGGAAPGMVGNLLRRIHSMPDGIGPTALRLIEDTMAKGLTLALIRRGGWMRAESIRRGDVVSGRLWQRHAAPAFHLSPFALHLCRWLASERQRRGECEPLEHTPATVADEFLLYLALDLTQRARCPEALAGQPAARASALCWLGFADIMARQVQGELPPADISVYGFALWDSDLGAVVMEALQPDLARRWIAMERDKRQIGRASFIIAIGRVQAAVLDACFSALNQAGRRDLAGFAITATRELLAEMPDAHAWEPALDPGGSLRQRSDARHAAVVLLRGMATIRGWIEQARGVRFFDDDYDVAQLLLRFWEPLGDGGYSRAAAIASEIESIAGMVDDPA